MLFLILRLFAFFIITFSLLPIQILIIFFFKNKSYIIPKIYHKICCKIFGIRIKYKGKISKLFPTLFVVNHASYIDIIILSSLFETSFVAKKEVSSWPLLGFLSKLQNTLFIDRKVSSLKKQENLILNHLKNKKNLVIFPEGTSSDGNKVLSFKSSLFNIFNKKRNFSIYVQTATIIYKKVDGIKLNRTQRRDITWHSNMDLIPNICNLLKKMSIDIEVIFDKKIIPKKSIDRKELAFFCWKNINYSLINNLYK